MRNLQAILIILVLAAGQATAVQAATFTVTSTADAIDANPGDGICDVGDGNCTLRAAIMETNALSGANTIILPAGVYNLSIAGIDEDSAATGDLDINSDLTINGAGDDSTIIDGGAIDRVIHVLVGNTVYLSDVTIQNGNIHGDGGGIFSYGTLELTRVTVRENTGGGGGNGSWWRYLRLWTDSG